MHGGSNCTKKCGNHTQQANYEAQRKFPTSFMNGSRPTRQKTGIHTHNKQTFVAFWLLGFLGFLASCWCMRLFLAKLWLWFFASSAFPVPLRQDYAAFGGLSSAFPVPLQLFVFVVGFLHSQHHQFLFGKSSVYLCLSLHMSACMYASYVTYVYVCLYVCTSSNIIEEATPAPRCEFMSHLFLNHGTPN